MPQPHRGLGQTASPQPRFRGRASVSPQAITTQRGTRRFDGAGARRVLDRNQHEVIVADEKHAELVWREAKRKTEMSEGEIDKAWEGLLHLVGNNTAAYGVAAGDSIAFGKVAYDISRGGAGWKGVRAVFTSYQNQRYIIFKGYAGLRKLLPGVRYLKTNPKIVQLGLGSFDVGKSVKSGGVFTAVLLCGFHVMDYLVRDTATLSQLIGNLGVDLAKVAISTGLTFVVTGALTTFSTTIALGPLALAIGVGMILAVGLDLFDSHFDIKAKVVSVLQHIWGEAEQSSLGTSHMVMINHSQKRRDYFENQHRKTLMRRTNLQGKF